MVPTKLKLIEVYQGQFGQINGYLEYLVKILVLILIDPFLATGVLIDSCLVAKVQAITSAYVFGP